MSATTPTRRRVGLTPPPAWIKPQLAKLVDKTPDGPDWLHEIKFDGYRMHARLHAGARDARHNRGGVADVPGVSATNRSLGRVTRAGDGASIGDSDGARDDGSSTDDEWFCRSERRIAQECRATVSVAISLSASSASPICGTFGGCRPDVG